MYNIDIYIYTLFCLRNGELGFTGSMMNYNTLQSRLFQSFTTGFPVEYRFFYVLLIKGTGKVRGYGDLDGIALIRKEPEHMYVEPTTSGPF